MSEENNLGESEQKETSEKPFRKGWNNLMDAFKGGFDKFQQSLEEQSKKNKEVWEENKDKVNIIFKDIKQDWENKVTMECRYGEKENRIERTVGCIHK